MKIERTDRVNWSSLKALRPGEGSPKHYLHALKHPLPDSGARKKGTLTHTLMYEPEKLDTDYAVMPRFHGGQNDDTAKENGYDGGKQAKAAWVAALRDDTFIVEQALYDDALGMRESLLSDPAAAPLFGEGYSEQLLEWTDEATGIECRGRLDHINGRVSDLKTTAKSIIPGRFARDIGAYGYFAQLAFYHDGLKANGVVPGGYPALIVVESSPPYDCIVLEFEKEDLEAGRACYRECLAILKECRETGKWPGVGKGKPHRVILPEWVKPEPEPLTFGGEAIDL